jgi:hypothetical protein
MGNGKTGRRAVLSTLLLVVGLVMTSTGLVGLAAPQDTVSWALTNASLGVFATPAIDGMLDASYTLLDSQAGRGDIFFDEDADYYYFLVRVSRDVVDNVFGPPGSEVSGYPNGHTFRDLQWNSHLCFKYADCDAITRLEFCARYIDEDGDGGWTTSFLPTPRVGDLSGVQVATSLIWNLQNTDYDYTNGSSDPQNWSSPPEGSGFIWEYQMQYEVRVPKAVYPECCVGTFQALQLRNDPVKPGASTDIDFDAVTLLDPCDDPTPTATATVETPTATATEPASTITPTATVAVETPTSTQTLPPGVPGPSATPTQTLPPGNPGPSATPTSSSSSSNTCLVSYVNVIVWGRIPVLVDMHVAGDLYESRMTAPNAEGEQQATFIIWPAQGQRWNVSVTPRLPANLDPAFWQFQTAQGSLQMTVGHCQNVETVLQLVSVTPTPAVTMLPVTGAGIPLSSLVTTALGLVAVSWGLVLRHGKRKAN